MKEKKKKVLKAFMKKEKTKAKAFVKSVLKEFFGAFALIETFLEICSDIMTEGVWPDDTRLDPVHCVGELRAIPGWWTSETIILHLMTSSVMRGLRLYFQQRFNISMEDRPLGETVMVMQFFCGPIDDLVSQSMPTVMGKLKEKYGDVAADPALVKIFMDKEAEVVRQFQADPQGYIESVRAALEASSATKH